VIPFARLAADGCPSHAALALSLAAEFHAADEAGAETVLATLAAALAPLREARAPAQLAGVGELVGARIGARVRPGRLEDLLLDRVLVTGAGDPICWAVICVHAAEQAGIPLGIVADAEDHVLVAHRELEAPYVLEPLAPAVPLEAERLPGGDLSWRGSHQVALMLLDRILARAERAGRHGDALRAAALRLELPLDERTIETLRDDADGIRARLN
jgi:hypothetical protein